MLPRDGFRHQAHGLRAIGIDDLVERHPEQVRRGEALSCSVGGAAGEGGGPGPGEQRDQAGQLDLGSRVLVVRMATLAPR